MKKDKVEIFEEFVIKNNIANSDNFFQRIAEIFGIQFNREIRVYNWYSSVKSNHLLLPKLLDVSENFLKIERLYDSSNIIDRKMIFLSLREFMLLGGDKAKLLLFDHLSSPGVSVIRGTIFGVINYGFRQHLKILLYIFKLYLNQKPHSKIYLIHKDLHMNQNIINTERGVYFFDFGSAVLTKRYFLTDVILLSLSFPELKFNPEEILYLLQFLGYDLGYMSLAKMQIQIILYNRFLHLHIFDKKNKEYMKTIKKFVSEIESLIANLDWYG